MITSLKLNLENLEEDLKKTEVTTMINSGWKIVSYVPVIDKDTPVLLVILVKDNNDISELSRSVTNYNNKSLILLLILCLSTITNIILYSIDILF